MAGVASTRLNTIGRDAADGDLGLVTREVYPPGFRSAFGPLVVAQESSLVHVMFPYNLNTEIVTATTANGGSASQANSLAVLATGAAANGSALLETRDPAQYFPGQGLIARFTAVFTVGVAGAQQEIGLGSSVDGFFFGYSGASFGIIYRRASADTFIAQSAWNGADRLDGQGLSGATLDPARGNVYGVQIQYLGFGSIRFFVENPVSGFPLLVHTLAYPNANTVPSLTNPSLPLHARAFKTSGTSNVVLSSGSMGVSIEGAIPRNGTVRGSLRNRKAGIGSTLTNVLTIRNNALFVAKTNRTRVRLLFLHVSVGGNRDAQIALVKNATLGGSPSFSDFDSNTSVVARDIAGTTVTGGREILSLVVDSDTSVPIDLSPYELRLNPGETLTCAAVNVSATGTIDPQVAVAWAEEF